MSSQTKSPDSSSKSSLKSPSKSSAVCELNDFATAFEKLLETSIKINNKENNSRSIVSICLAKYNKAAITFFGRDKNYQIY